MMKGENAIEVRNVRKSFKVFLDKGHTMKEMVLFKKRRRFEKRMVLDGISFDVKKGEAVGLIGHNGCGKSTTLKLLTRIIYPDEGTIEMKGRVSSLIELGAGFHPDMSGRENIYINASIFGLKKHEIDERLDDIIAFSELEEFIDNPVRTYSSGMYMRLAFSVAINVDADILLIDEILAVGDAGFQAKCFNKMREIKAAGTTIVLVSHSMGQVEQLCDRSIWIHKGKLREEGIPKEVDLKYLEYMTRERKKREEISAAVPEKEQVPEDKKEEHKDPDQAPAKGADEDSGKKEQEKKEPDNRYGSREAAVRKVELLNEEKIPCRALDTEDPCMIRVEYSVKRPVADVQLGIGIFRSDGVQCYGTNTRIDHMDRFDLEKDGYYECRLDRIGLLPGLYWVDVAIETGEGIPVDYYKQALKFEVLSPLGDVGVARIAHQWKIG